LLKQIYRQQLRIAPFPLPGVNDLPKQVAEMRLVRFIRAKETRIGKY